MGKGGGEVNWMLCRALAMVVGFAGEQLVGWPRRLYHPIMAIGALISKAEKLLRAVFSKSRAGERAAGILMALTLPLISLGLTGGLLYVLYRWSWIAGFLVESAMCWSIFASGSLRDAAGEVGIALSESLDAGRKAVAMIVGRDTERLTEEGVIKATVETVAEDLSDGVIAPLVFTALGGTGAARLDDVCNFLPARLTALLMILLSGVCGLDRRGAWRVFRRDRYCHASPNSAQTESAMAGALGIQLGGDAWYFGQLHKKKTIGDSLRPVEPADIPSAIMLMTVVSDVAVGLAVILLAWIGGLRG